MVYGNEFEIKKKPEYMLHEFTGGVVYPLQRKVFEEDRALWLKHQFLNFTPFADSKKPPMSKSKSAFLICECPRLHTLLALFTHCYYLPQSHS